MQVVKVSKVSFGHPFRGRQWPVWAMIVVVAAALGWAAIIATTNRRHVTKDTFQAVSLTSGQVYFGKLSSGPAGYVILEHPYVTQTVQPADTADKAAPTTTLVKVRDQVYGPEDKMFIRTEQIAFWQNLRKDSKVMSAIQQKQGR
jgi:hypothetical protein